MRSKMSRTASPSTNATSRGNRATSSVASGAQRQSIRMRRAVSSHRARPARLSPRASGLRVWAGKAGDPFWIEPDVLHAVGHAFQDGTVVNLAGWDPSRAKNLFAGHTVYSIVLEVPDGELLARRRRQSPHRCLGCVNARHRRRRMAFDQSRRSSHDAPSVRSVRRRFSATVSNAGRPADDFATYGGPSPSRSPAPLPHMEQPKIPGHMRRESPTGFSPTSFHTRSAHPPRSGSPSGMAARLQITRPMLCSRSRRILPFVLGSARSQSRRSRRRRSRMFLPPENQQQQRRKLQVEIEGSLRPAHGGYSAVGRAT